MKKLLLFPILFLCLIFLSSCDKPPVCGEDDMLIDGTCVPLEPEAIALKEALETMKMIDNYRLSIGLSRGEEHYVMELSFDDNRSSFRIGDMTEYYENTQEGCFRYLMTTDGYQGDSYDCSFEPDPFYQYFDFDWFTWIDGVYYLEYQHLNHVSAFFQSEMEGSTASNFTLTLVSGRFDQFELDVNHDGAIWNVTMTFSDFDQVTIDLEEVRS